MTDKWQPIETAPKDQPIIVPEIRAGYCLPVVCVWSECPFTGQIFGDAWRPLENRQKALNPIHWMPLPEPPEAE